MRISDWSLDVCSSDLGPCFVRRTMHPAFTQGDLFDPTRVSWIRDADEIDKLIREILRHPYITYDIEGTVLDEHATEGGPTTGGVHARVPRPQLTLARQLAALDPVPWLGPLPHQGAQIWEQ